MSFAGRWMGRVRVGPCTDCAQRNQDAAQIAPPHSLIPYVDGPLLARLFGQSSDQIACVHMSGLLSRSHMNAGQDGFRDASSKHHGDLWGQWDQRSVSRLGSIDHTICSLPCKFWHRLSTVAVKLLPVSG
jgi:hypothetical protein